MSYLVALNKAWEDLAAVQPSGKIALRFLADEYNIDIAERKVLSLSCNVAAKEFTAILLLHYLAQKIKGIPSPSGEWLPFRELSGIEGYYEAFHKRAVEPVIRKYGSNPEGFFSVTERLPARRAEFADAALILTAFEGVEVLIKLWRADEEFGPDANIFFDRSITRIFCVEDIIVLAGMIASAL